MNLMMNGLSKILRRLQSTYFNLVATISGVLYTCRAAIVHLISTVQSVVQSAVSTWREEHSTSIAMYTELSQMLSSSTTLERIWSLIKSFGSLVIKTILIGYTSLMFTVGLIARGVYALAGMMMERFTTK